MNNALKAWILLLLATAMQLSVVFKGLHHHEEVCLLSETAELEDQQVLHAHADEHDACAWDAFHISSGTLALPLYFSFLQEQVQLAWAPLAPAEVLLLALQPSGRAPPAA